MIFPTNVAFDDQISLVKDGSRWEDRIHHEEIVTVQAVPERIGSSPGQRFPDPGSIQLPNSHRSNGIATFGWLPAMVLQECRG